MQPTTRVCPVEGQVEVAVLQHDPSGWLLGRDELGLRVQGDTSATSPSNLRLLRVRSNSNTWPVGVSTTQNPHLTRLTLHGETRKIRLYRPDPSKVVTKELSDLPRPILAPSSCTVLVRDDAIRRPPFHPLPVTETLRGPLRPPSPTTGAAATPSPCHRR